MPSFASGLLNAATAAATGLAQGSVEKTRAMLAERRRREADARAAAAAELARQKEAHQEEQDRIKNLTLGYTPASTSVRVEPEQPAGAAPVSFGDALEGGLGPFAPASKAEAGAAVDQAPSLTKPLAEGSLGAVPHVRVVNTPESYDPSRSAAAATIGARGDESRRTAADQHTARMAELALREAGQDRRGAAANASRERAAAIRAGAGGAGGGRGNITATAKESAKRTMLDGWMQYHGSEDALRQYLSESPIAQAAMQRLDITDADIIAAVGRATGRRVEAVVRTDPRHPERAVARTDSARAAVVARMQRPTTRQAGTEAPPRQPVTAPGAAPAPIARPPRSSAAPPQQRFDDEAQKYQAAVAKITANFTGAERTRRLKAASDIYNSRVAGAAGR